MSSSSGEQSAIHLQGLIQAHQIRQICIYQLSTWKVYTKRLVWRLGHEFIEVGASSYTLNRLAKYPIEDSTLWLYF